MHHCLSVYLYRTLGNVKQKNIQIKRKDTRVESDVALILKRTLARMIIDRDLKEVTYYKTIIYHFYV